MDKIVAIVFYIVLGSATIGAAWMIDAGQNQPVAKAAEVKSPVINLNASDFDESKNLKDAVDRLSKPVPKPTTEGMLNQLQPTVKNQETPELPQWFAAV